MNCPKRNQIEDDEANQYAKNEDFCKLFRDHMDGLYILALLLTGDHKKAEVCFVSSLEDCVIGNRVFKHWAHSWAKRVIIRNAIRALQPGRGRADSFFTTTIPSNEGKGWEIGHGRSEIDRVLALEDFERFVFVMSVLERYSELECALLLSCPTMEIGRSRSQALEQIGEAACTPCSDRVSAWHRSDGVTLTASV